MEHAAVIETLGGPAAVARLLNCHYSRPLRWREDGIPRRRWPDLVGAAAEAGKPEITFEALLAGEPRKCAG